MNHPSHALQYTFVSVCFIMFCAVSSARDLPLKNMPGATTQTVRADAQAVITSNKSPVYASTQLETVAFMGKIVPLTSDLQLAVFSDDGVTVTVDLEPLSEGITSEGAPQHLPTLSQSFHLLKAPTRGWQAGRSYKVCVWYKNSKYNAKGDIDGCTLYAFGGGVAAIDYIYSDQLPNIDANYVPGHAGQGANLGDDHRILVGVRYSRQRTQQYTARRTVENLVEL